MLAQGGGHGVLVPEIVATYRSHFGSIITVTDLNRAEPWGALLEKYPFLLAEPASLNGSDAAPASPPAAAR